MTLAGAKGVEQCVRLDLPWRLEKLMEIEQYVRLDSPH